MDDDEEEDVFADKIIGLTYCECIFLDSKEEFLLATSRNEDINQRDPISGDAPLVASIKLGRKELIPMVLDLNPDPNLRNNCSDSALHWAGLKGFDDIVTRLLKIGGDKDAKGEFGNTPLHLACSGSHVECVNIMLMIKSFMENAELAKKILMAEELEKKRKQEEDVQVVLGKQQEIERRKMEEEVFIKAKLNAVAVEELRIEQEEVAIEAAHKTKEEQSEQERLEVERLTAEEKKVAKKGTKKKKKNTKKKK